LGEIVGRETTLDRNARSLLQVKIKEVGEADDIS
jgi:DNA gyrase/topoisomerase IV subunit B